MKLAAILTLALSLILGGWAAYDWHGNKVMLDFHGQLYHDSSDPRVIHDSDLMRQDTFAGFIAFALLLASVAMFAKSKP